MAIHHRTVTPMGILKKKKIQTMKPPKPTLSKPTVAAILAALNQHRQCLRTGKKMPNR